MNVTQLGHCVAQGYLSVLASPPAIRTPFCLEPGTFDLGPAHYRLIYPIRSFFVINVNDNIIMAHFNISQ